MNCQEYQRWIEDAASGALAGTIAGAVDSSRRTRLDAHLAVCPECRRAFGTAQRLYAAIDQGVAARVEGTPSADFAARVRMRLAGEPHRLQFRRWRPGIWIPALGSAALALLLLSVWIGRRPSGHRPPPPTQQTAHTTVAPKPASPGNVRPPGQASVTRPPAAPSTARRTRVAGATRPSRKLGLTPDSEAPQLPVQIQPGQWAAVTSLYRAGQAGKLGTLEQPVPADKPLQIAPVEVPPLVIAEIQDPKPVGSEPESTNVPDR
ncbi:MAG TPA: hypothetical protein VGZ29_10940 [Terriglobia bacterium]|nr:hypothetical protein [Terriglobia bacterium]